jgi:DNA-binding phage protein
MEGVHNFLDIAMKTDSQDFIGKMEGFVVQGIKGMSNIVRNSIYSFESSLEAAQNHQQCALAVQSEIQHEISEGLSAYF